MPRTLYWLLFMTPPAMSGHQNSDLRKGNFPSITDELTYLPVSQAGRTLLFHLLSKLDENDRQQFNLTRMRVKPRPEGQGVTRIRVNGFV
jgi:hypothetical protein